jgi:hypothetical protein
VSQGRPVCRREVEPVDPDLDGPQAQLDVLDPHGAAERLTQPRLELGGDDPRRRHTQHGEHQ